METEMLVRAVMALAIVLGLLFLCAAALRRWGSVIGLTVIPKNGASTRSITVIESTMLDSRHRIVRVRIEGREHVIVLGGASPVVVESKDAKAS
jgi:flagellar protein FliO/FliZ